MCQMVDRDGSSPGTLYDVTDLCRFSNPAVVQGEAFSLCLGHLLPTSYYRTACLVAVLAFQLDLYTFLNDFSIQDVGTRYKGRVFFSSYACRGQLLAGVVETFRNLTVL